MKNPSQASHDIHLSGVYLYFLRTAPALAAGWVGEDVLAPSRVAQKLPTAVLPDGAGRPRRALEVAGAYPAARAPQRIMQLSGAYLPKSRIKP